YAAWQRRSLAGERLEAQLDFWRAQLGGAPALLELPTDRPRPAVQSHAGAHETLVLDAELTQGLRALGRREGATLFMVLLCAWQALLSRYSGQTDVVVGSPIAGRTRPELEGLIGFFVNMLALRADLGDDPGFTALLGQARGRTLGAYEHQEIPFERLVEELAPERSLSHGPLFQVVFALQNAPRQALSLAGLELRSSGVDLGKVRFDMEILLWENEEGIQGSIAYAADLFEAETVRRLARHYAVLLSAVAADPGRRLSGVELLDAAERRQVLESWSGTAAVREPEGCLHSLFQAQAGLTPAAVALEWAGGELTYGEMEAHANRLARHLRARGVGPEVRVGLCLERSPHMLVAMLAILKAGGAYVPLDPAYPAERLAFMVRDSDLALLVSAGDAAERLHLPASAVVHLERDAGEIAAASDRPLDTGVPPGALAYVMYTSGSTGTPKGVAVTHGNVVRLVRRTSFVHFGPGEVFLQLAPVSFDASTFEIWGALLNGARLAIAPPGKLSLEELGQVVQRHRVSTLWLTAGLFHQ
ncbi:MAG TPA: AMP-binding protein, partial [Longimicrobiaceae bacterium]|nr:AMP-binding protein [Longimicrobiaceae bacterium]